jgi:tryptophan synthase beta chain
MTAARTYGEYGGRYVPETLIPALDELETGWREALADPTFRGELEELGRNYGGRPTPLTLAERFAPGKRLYLKREDLLHTGAHKLNNALGQAVLAQRLGKRRIVAETGAGQHGVATATVCARFGFDCVVYMGAEDMRRQAPNVERMGLLGAKVRRDEDLEGGNERGDPGLDHERGEHPLPDRLVRRPSSLPRDRGRASGRDRPRGPRADPRS